LLIAATTWFFADWPVATSGGLGMLEAADRLVAGRR
jgi:hypothetical protein